MTSQAGQPWISLMADYLIAESAGPEQLLNDANLWLDQARTLLQLIAPEHEGWAGEAASWLDGQPMQVGIEGVDRLLQMAQGCISQAHLRLLRQKLAERASALP